jgi:hypothetical protein
MASNSLPTNAAQVIGLGTKMQQGLITFGEVLKITQVTAAELQAELSAFITSDGDFNAARSAKQAAYDTFKPAEVALSERLQVTRNVLAARFGNRWSTMWAQAGFINASTAVPTRIEDRFGLALNLANFFTANPTFEVASMGVTAAALTTLRNNALTAQQAVLVADSTLKTKGSAWDTAFATLTDTMRSLVNILRATLDDNDPRWLQFGLEMPATNTTPAKPANVTAHLDATGAIVTQCDSVPLATRYRWRMMIVGVDTDYRLAARSVDPMGSITGIMPGQRLQIVVQAVNGNLQGVASEPIQFTMPVPAKALAAEPHTVPSPVAHVLDEIVIPTNGNGHRNGDRLPALV